MWKNGVKIDDFHIVDCASTLFHPLALILGHHCKLTEPTFSESELPWMLIDASRALELYGILVE